MKKSLLLSSALVLGVLAPGAGPAGAGGLAEPVMEAEVVRAETASSASHDFLVPLMALILFAAASSADGGGAVAVSDARCKTEIRPVGVLPQGLMLYRWRYAGLPGQWEGVMAQEVAACRPEALVQLPFGVRAVDYARLGLTPRRVS